GRGAGSACEASFGSPDNTRPPRRTATARLHKGVAVEHTFREIVVPEAAAGMRLDRFLAARFRDRSRSWLARGIRAGEVRDAADRPLRASARLREGQVVRLYVDGIAPTGDRPPLPPVLHQDDRVVVFDKPPGLLAHPVGTQFAWGLINLAREAWPGEELHLVHRLDRDTSGCIVLARDADAAPIGRASCRE